MVGLVSLQEMGITAGVYIYMHVYNIHCLVIIYIIIIPINNLKVYMGGLCTHNLITIDIFLEDKVVFKKTVCVVQRAAEAV